MTGHPRRPEPLRPPPDRFAAVYREAQARRFHRAAAACGITGVFLAGIFGGLAMGGPSGVRDTIAAAVNQTSAATTTTSPASRSLQASKLPATGRTRTKDDATTPVPAPRKPGATYLRGEILDTSGAPVSRLYVYAGSLTEKGFVPRTPPARTNSAGWYSVACTGGPLLVTSWPLNARLGSEADGAYAARFVDTPSCGTVRHHVVSVVEAGAVVTGMVRTDVACPGTEFPLWLWVDGHRSAAVRLSGLREGDRYRISGAPEGTSVLGARGRIREVALRAGRTTAQDVTFACPVAPTRPPEPSTTPLPTPSETTTPPGPGPTTTGPDPSPSSPAPSGSGTGGSGTASPSPH